MTPDEARAVPALIIAALLLIGLMWPRSKD